MENLEVKIENILRNILEVESSSVKLAKDEYPHWDSLKHLDILFALEEEFGVTFDPEEIHLLVNPVKIAEIVRGKLES